MRKQPTNRLSCNQQDIDCPRLLCGHSLPCPRHTYRIDLGAEPPTVTVPVTAKKRYIKHVSRIAEVLKP